jgi:hypothetical protein
MMPDHIKRLVEPHEQAAKRIVDWLEADLFAGRLSLAALRMVVRDAEQLALRYSAGCRSGD